MKDMSILDSQSSISILTDSSVNKGFIYLLIQNKNYPAIFINLQIRVALNNFFIFLCNIIHLSINCIKN